MGQAYRFFVVVVVVLLSSTSNLSVTLTERFSSPFEHERQKGGDGRGSGSG